jgi:PRC-barrel domain
VDGSSIVVDDRTDLGGLRGAQVHGSAQTRLGQVDDLYADQLTGRWEWALVRPEGGDERDARLVPLVEAEVEGDVLHVPYDAATVTSAPDVGAAGHLNVDDEAQLYVHFGLDPWEHGSKSGGRTGGTPTGVPLPSHTDAGPRDQDGDDGGVV